MDEYKEVIYKKRPHMKLVIKTLVKTELKAK